MICISDDFFWKTWRVGYIYVREIQFSVNFLEEKFVLSMFSCIFATTESATLPI